LHICKKSINFKVLKLKLILGVLMSKITTNSEENQIKNLFSFSEVIPEKKIQVDFKAPDISSNGGLVLAGLEKENIARKIARLIPDNRNHALIVHSYEEMVCQRVGQIMCGYEDANDCDRLRHDSALKMSVGRKPSDSDLCSQPTMTRLENHVDRRTLYAIAWLFVWEYIGSFSKAPKRVILDVDDTNADTYGAQQLSLFNDYYNELCYMPLVIFDGMNGKLILPLLRPGRRNKSLNIFGVLRRLAEYLHKIWPHTIIELRGDSHFCCHEFMDWSKTHRYVRFTTGLGGNSALMKKIDKPLRRAQGDYMRHKEDIRRYYSFDYKAKSWKYSQRVIAKIEVTSMGVNIRFIVTSNRNNTPETVYRRYCGRGEMELWIKDLKYFHADRMSCSSFKANTFRLFLYGAAYIIAHRLKVTVFAGTEIEVFTMDSFIKKIMLSAVHIVEKKTFVRFSFSPHHRHLEALALAFGRLSA